MHKIVWTSKSKIQYSQVIAFWCENNDSSTYSIEIQNSLDSVLKLLSSNPRMGKVFSDNIRRLIIVDRYSVYYKVSDIRREIYILAFKDNRSDPNKLTFL